MFSNCSGKAGLGPITERLYCTYRQRAHPDLEKRIPYSKWKDAVPTRFWSSFDSKIKQKTATKTYASSSRKAGTTAPPNREVSDTEIHVYTVRPCNVKIRNSKPDFYSDIEFSGEEVAVEENTRSASGGETADLEGFKLFLDGSQHRFIGN